MSYNQTNVGDPEGTEPSVITLTPENQLKETDWPQLCVIKKPALWNVGFVE